MLILHMNALMLCLVVALCLIAIILKRHIRSDHHLKVFHEPEFHGRVLVSREVYF